MPAAKSKSPSNQIHIQRIYDAPVKTVWEAWQDPRQVAQWWGPRGFTLTSHSKDLRAGGHWKYTMHGPDGTNWPNTTIYHEVQKYERMVYDHGGSEDRPPLFRVTVLFKELPRGRTQLDMTMSLPTPEEAEQTRKFIKKAGGDSTWDRLAEYLAKGSSGKEQFVINRAFDAPIELMHEMWTNPKHFKQWLAPTGAEMEFIRADIRAGGNTFYYMTYDGGQKMYGRANYLEVGKDRLVYTQEFCDEHEKLSRHPMAPTWPATMLTTVQLTAEGPDRTRVTITWEPYGQCTAEEIATFVQARGGMTQGWTGSLDKLEEKLGAKL